MILVEIPCEVKCNSTVHTCQSDKTYEKVKSAKYIDSINNIWSLNALYHNVEHNREAKSKAKANENLGKVSFHFLVFFSSYIQTLQLETILECHEKKKYVWFEDPRQDKGKVEHETHTWCNVFKGAEPLIYDKEFSVDKCISLALNIVDIQLHCVVSKTDQNNHERYFVRDGWDSCNDYISVV